MDVSATDTGGTGGQQAIPPLNEQIDTFGIDVDIIDPSIGGLTSQSIQVVRGATDQPQAASKLTTLSIEDVYRTKSSNLDEQFVKRLIRMKSDQQQTPQPVSQALDVLRKDVFTFVCAQLNQRNISTQDLEQRYLNWCLPKFLDRDIWDRIMTGCIFVSPNELARVLDLHDVPPVYNAQPTGATSYYVRTFEFRVHEFLQLLSELSAEGYDYNQKLYHWTSQLKNIDPFTVIYIRYNGMTGYVPWMRHVDDLSKDTGSFALAFIQKTLLSFPDIIKNALVQELQSARVDFAVDQSILNVREQALIGLLDTGSINTEAGGAFQHDPTTEDEQMFATLRTRVTTQIPSATRQFHMGQERQLAELASNIATYANNNPVLTGTNVFSFVKVHTDAISSGMTPSLTHAMMTPFVTMGSDIPLSAFKDPKTFFLDASSSAHMSATAFNYFGAWEESLDRFDPGYVTQQVKGKHLPFVDLFPWPKRDSATLESAMGFVRRYFEVANPLVILCYGELVSKVAVGNLRHSNGLVDGGLTDALGHVYLRNHTLSGEDAGFYVAVPSFHPGSIAYRGTSVGITKSIFLMTAMIGWLGYHEALLRTRSNDTKKAICEQIISAINEKTSVDTPFGKRLARLKQELARELAAKRGNFLTDAEKKARAAKVKVANQKLAADRRFQNVRQTEQMKAALTVKYVVYTGAKGLIMASPSTIWAQARKELDVILNCGFSFAAPHSPERIQEVEAIYQRHVANLENSTATRGDKAKFLEFAKSYKVPKGGSYYLAAADVDDTVKDLPNLIRCFLPGHVTDPYDAKWSRVFNHTMQSAAIAALRDWVNSIAATAGDDREVATLVATKWFEHMKNKDSDVFAVLGAEGSTGHAAQRDIFETNDDLNGVEIAIKAHWGNYDATVVKHSFSWRTSDGGLATMENLPLPRTVMPQTNSDKRFIFFVPEGIDIKDQNGVSIDAYEPKGKTRVGNQTGKQRKQLYPTLPIATIVATISSHPHAKHFLALWEKQTGRTVDQAIEDSQVQTSLSSSDEAVIPAEYFTNAGPSRPLPTCISYTGNAKRAVSGLLPVYPGDGLWLLHEFFSEYYPQGGEVRVTNPSEDPDANSAFRRLGVFLQKPLYRQHPFVRDMRALVQLTNNGGNDKKTGTSTLKSAADVLRGLTKPATTSTTRVAASVGSGTMVIGVTKFSIGAAAPANAIANVAPPVLASTVTEEVIEETIDSDNGEDPKELDDEEMREEDEATQADLRAMLDEGPTSTGTPERKKRARDEEDSDDEFQPPTMRRRRNE